jgi:hypothetical protein
MKIARTALAAAALAAMMLAPAHLAAQAVDPIAEAFERGRNSGTTPLTSGEKTMCAGYWGSWAELMTTPPSDEEMAGLPWELRIEGVFGISIGWDINLLANGVKQAELDQAKAKALDEVMAALGGEDPAASARYFETLGTCLPPWHESSK